MGLFATREKEPKHRSILAIRNVRTPKSEAKKKFESAAALASPDLTSLDISDYPRQQTRNQHNKKSATLEKTKLLVDTSLKGEVERNIILEQQLKQVSGITSKAYDEIYALRQNNLQLQKQLHEKDEELKRKQQYHNSMSTVSTLNSMLSTAKSVSTTTTSIHHDNDTHTEELDQLRAAVSSLEKKLNVAEMVNRKKDSQVQVLRQTVQSKNMELSALQTELVEKDVKIDELTQEQVTKLIQQNKSLTQLKTALWQLSRNYNHLYTNNEDMKVYSI